MSGKLGGVLNYGNQEQVTLSKNMKFSFRDKMEGGKYKPSERNSVWDDNGTVRTWMAQFQIGGSDKAALNTIIGGDKQLTESDLIAIMNRPTGNINKVTAQGNGVYVVEYTRNGENGNDIISYMQFDFETEEERATIEANRAAENRRAEERQAESQNQSGAKTEELSTFKKIVYWFNESWLAH